MLSIIIQLFSRFFSPNQIVFFCTPGPSQLSCRFLSEKCKKYKTLYLKMVKSKTEQKKCSYLAVLAVRGGGDWRTFQRLQKNLVYSYMVFCSFGEFIFYIAKDFSFRETTFPCIGFAYRRPTSQGEVLNCDLTDKERTTSRKHASFLGGKELFSSTLLHLPPLRFHCVGGCQD